MEGIKKIFHSHNWGYSTGKPYTVRLFGSIPKDWIDRHCYGCGKTEQPDSK